MQAAARPLTQQIARWLAGVAGLFALTTLVGYAVGAPQLVTMRAGLKGMSPLTATALAALALAVQALTLGRVRLTRAATTLAAVCALSALVSHAVVGSDRLSAAIAGAVFGVAADRTGFVAVATAVAILLLAAALTWRRQRPFIADRCTGLALFISGTALLGYAYNVGDLYAIPIFNTMAINTAAALFALSLATLLAVPDSGWMAVVGSSAQGGAHTRQLLGLVMLPPLVGAVLVRATEASRVGAGASMAVLVIVTIVPLMMLIIRNGRVRLALDAERRAKSELQGALTLDLEGRLNAKVAELEQATAEREKAEQAVSRSQRMEAIGQLTGGIAHDFNNLLQALSGNVTLLQRRLVEGDPARKFADNAAKSIQKGAKLTSQLMAFSRSQRLSIRPVRVRASIQDSFELVRHGLGPAIGVVIEPSVDDWWVQADATQLELALVNLMVNARDAMTDSGSITITTRLMPAVPPAVGQLVAIVVADTGSGMSSDILNRAVEPFFTTKAQGKGTGLGLAQVYGFARQCGGDLRIESRPGEGTTVSILLPRAVPPVTDVPIAQPVVAQASQGTIEATRHVVLVIDDDESVRSVITQGLRDAGFDVLEAVDGAGGLQVLDHARPAAAVIDFLMPGMNGAEVARRARSRIPGLPIVFVSGYSDTLALDAVPNAVLLRKPFDLDGLRDAVAQALR